MEEKKLTDEMIVKALEMDCLCVVYGDCESCPFFDKDCRILPKAIKDLIHRLQDENKRLSLIAGIVNKGVAVEIVNMQETIDKQKAKIERLTEERDKAKRDNTSLIYNISRVEKENDELRKQVEELKIYLASEKVCSKQAVKDTAKEILDKAIIIDKNTGDKGFICIEALTELCKSKGVEVE